MDWKTHQAMRLCEKQRNLYKREIVRVERMERKAQETLPERVEKFKPRYKTPEEMNEAYMIGEITFNELRRERYRWWQTYSDRYRGIYLRWLKEEYSYYAAKLERYMDMKDAEREGWEEKRRDNKNRKRRRQRYINRYRRAERARKREAAGKKPRPKPRRRVNR